MSDERWSISVRRVVDGETFLRSRMPDAPLGFAAKWVADLDDNEGYSDSRTHHFGWTRDRAVKKARRHARKVEQAEASEEVVRA